MTAPILRDIELALPLHDVAVARGDKPVLSLWCGRAGETAEVTYAMTEVTPSGTQGAFGGSVPAVAGYPGFHRVTLSNTLPGRYYRLTVTAEEVGVGTDSTQQQFQFMSTPG